MAESSTEEQIQVPTVFTCGAEVRDHEHEGGVVGCCYSCGLMLCEIHVYHLPFDFRLGKVNGVSPHPLSCGTCAGPIGKRGLPEAPTARPRATKRRGFSLPFRLPSFRRSGRGRKSKSRV